MPLNKIHETHEIPFKISDKGRNIFEETDKMLSNRFNKKINEKKYEGPLKKEIDYSFKNIGILNKDEEEVVREFFKFNQKTKNLWKKYDPNEIGFDSISLNESYPEILNLFNAETQKGIEMVKKGDLGGCGFVHSQEGKIKSNLCVIFVSDNDSVNNYRKSVEKNKSDKETKIIYPKEAKIILYEEKIDIPKSMGYLPAIF